MSRSTLAPAAWLAALHLVSSFPLPFTWGDFGVALLHPSVDLVFVIAVTALGTALGRGLMASRIGGALLLLSWIHQAALSLIPAFLERRFEFADLREIPSLYHLMLHDQPTWQQGLALLGVPTVLYLAYRSIAQGLVHIAALGRKEQLLHRFTIAAQSAVLLGVLVASFSSAHSLWRPSALGAFLREAGDEFADWCHPEVLDAAVEQSLSNANQRMNAEPPDMRGLGGADVHLMFVESYGRLVQRHPALMERMRPVYAELERDLQAKGFRVQSTACFPEVSGGGSWLTHAQLYAGVPVPDRFTFDRVVASTLRPLPKRFQAAGYRTIEVLPAMHRHWNEGSIFYGFDEALTQQELDYRGTTYHWGKMPDQYALHKLLQDHVLPAKQRLFTSFVSVTSHAPFRMIPPYVADWQIDAKTFAGPPRIEHPITWLNMLQDPVALTAYGDAIEYSLRSIGGFACRLTRPSLIIVLGDHQPPIAATVQPPDNTKDVLLHVWTNKPELLQPLQSFGFVEGSVVPQDKPAFSTVEIAPGLLHAYGR